MKRALGLAEISRLFTAVVAADIMAKAANIRILEIENTEGLGYMIIKVAGNVGAANAAVNARKQIGAVDDKLISRRVISRPSDYVEQAFCCPELPVPPFPPMKGAQEETGARKIGETIRESPETAGELESDGGQADSVREETDPKDEPQAEAEQPSEGRDFRLAEKSKKVSRRTSATEGTGIARSKNS